MTLMRAILWNKESRNETRVGGEDSSLSNHGLAVELVYLVLWARGMCWVP